MSSNRREFLKYAGAFTLGSLLLPGCVGSTSTAAGTAKATGNLGPLGLQLYSVKDVIEQDLKGTLEKLAAIGYKEVESYPGRAGHFYGLEPKVFSAMLRDVGMKLVSSHVGSGSRNGKSGTWQQASLLQNFNELASKAAETGQKYITCSWMDQSLRNTSEDLKYTADLFNKTGEIAKKAGLTFAYHNHDFEYKKVGDAVLYDFMLANTDKDLVKYELDLYWVVAGNKDPLAYFKNNPNRFPLVHVKDMDKMDRTKNTEIGSGSINYTEILKAAKSSGTKHFLVEQETFTRPSVESMKLNYEYLSKLSV